MAYSLACADAGQDCPAAFTTETQDELMRHVEMHAETAHPEMELNDELRQQIGGLVKTT